MDIKAMKDKATRIFEREKVEAELAATIAEERKLGLFDEAHISSEYGFCTEHDAWSYSSMSSILPLIYGAALDLGTLIAKVGTLENREKWTTLMRHTTKLNECKLADYMLGKVPVKSLDDYTGCEAIDSTSERIN